MRLKVVIPFILLVFSLLGGVFCLKSFTRPAPSLPMEKAESSPTSQPRKGSTCKSVAGSELSNVTSLSNSGAMLQLSAIEATQAANTNGWDQEKTIRKRVIELYSLAMNDDTASRDAILVELNNENPTIRKAALAAAVQFNDRSVVPFLLEFAAQTEDPREKVAILDAIDYIKLPSLTEYLNEMKQKGQVNGPPRPPDLKANSASPKAGSQL